MSALVVKQLNTASLNLAPPAELSALCASITRLPSKHATLVALINAVAAYAAGIRCDGIGEVSELLDRASDACDDLYIGARA
jgi:hypothetical protein